MSFFHLFILAVIQGITEFLPVSSSAHLILLPNFTDLPDQGQVMDVAVHIGTLAAVMIYFRRDVAQAALGAWHLVTQRRNTDEARLMLLLIIATVPVVIIGLVLKLTGWSDALRSVTVIGWAMLLFGLVLYWTDQKGASVKQQSDWNMRDAIILGLWQAIALIPGTSRSGAAISGARTLGYTREDGTKIAMLMSIPTIIASGSLLGAEVVLTANVQMAKDGVIAAGFAFFAALAALGLMMRLLRTVSFTPYVIYRVILGVVLLGYAYA